MQYSCQQGANFTDLTHSFSHWQSGYKFYTTDQWWSDCDAATIGWGPGVTTSWLKPEWVYCDGFSEAFISPLYSFHSNIYSLLNIYVLTRLCKKMQYMNIHWWNRACLSVEHSINSDSHIACRAHAVPLPCRAAKGLECVFPIWFTQCCRVWFTLAMPGPCRAPTMPFFSRPRHRAAVERRPVGDVPAIGFFRLPRGVLGKLLSEAYWYQLQVASVKPNTRKSLLFSCKDMSACIIYSTKNMITI